MQEQLQTTKERSLAKPRKLIRAALKNPLTYGAIGISIAAWGFVDVATTPNKVNRQLDETFPLPVSAERIDYAQKEVLVFNRNVHAAVIKGNTKIDVTEFSKQPQIAQAITIANQQEQRDSLKEHLDAQATVRQLSKVVGGLIVVIGAAIIPSLRPLLKKDTTTISEAIPQTTVKM